MLLSTTHGAHGPGDPATMDDDSSSIEPRPCMDSLRTQSPPNDASPQTYKGQVARIGAEQDFCNGPGRHGSPVEAWADAHVLMIRAGIAVKFSWPPAAHETRDASGPTDKLRRENNLAVVSEPYEGALRALGRRNRFLKH